MATRRRLAWVPALVAALATSACWPVPGGNADRSAHNAVETAFTPDTVGDLVPAWVAPLGPGAAGPAVVDGGGVFVRLGRDVTRLRLASGAASWTWQLPEELRDVGSTSDPLVVDGRLLIGYGYGNLGGNWTGVALDPVTGDPVGGPVASGLLQTARGTVAIGQTFSFGSLTPVLVGYSLVDLDGATAVRGGAVSIESSGGSAGTFTLGAASVYHAGNGLLPAADGSVTQGAGVRRFPYAATDGCGPPSAEVFLCPTWATPLPAATGVVVGPGEQVLYVGRSDGTVAALDAATGAVLWTADVGAGVTATPALADGVLFVPTADGDLVAVDAGGCGAATCSPSWSARIDGTALAKQPAVAGSGDDAVVFAGTSGGTLAAVAAAGCGAATCPTPLWQAPVGAAVTGAPAVSSGRVVVGTASGDVAAFQLPTS